VSEESAGAAGEADAGIGWFRAILSGVVILVIGLGATVWGADAVLKKVTGLSRDNRQYLACALFFTVLIAMAWALRRLQQRGLI
jgi:hypothetical protein